MLALFPHLQRLNLGEQGFQADRLGDSSGFLEKPQSGIRFPFLEIEPADVREGARVVRDAAQLLESSETAVPEAGRAGPSAQSHLSLPVRDVDHKERVLFLEHLDEAF